MHQNRWRLGLRPRPRWGAYSAPPHPLAVMGWDRDLMTPPGFSQHPPRPKSWINAWAFPIFFLLFSITFGNVVPSRDLHGPDFVGPARPGPARRPHDPARPGPGPELSLGPGPFRPVAWPSPARPGPARSGPQQKQFPWDFLKLFNLIKQSLFNGFVGYLFVTDAPQG